MLLLCSDIPCPPSLTGTMMDLISTVHKDEWSEYVHIQQHGCVIYELVVKCSTLCTEWMPLVQTAMHIIICTDCVLPFLLR